MADYIHPHPYVHPLRAGGRGGLGADLDNPALLAKQAQAARAKEYAKRAQQRTAVLGDVSHGIGNRDAMASQQQGGSHKTPPDTSGSCSRSSSPGRQEWGRRAEDISKAQQARARQQEYAQVTDCCCCHRRCCARRVAVACPPGPSPPLLSLLLCLLWFALRCFMMVMLLYGSVWI